MSEKICSSSGALRKKKIQDETQFTTKLVEKLVWVPVLSFLYNFHSQLCIRWPVMPKLAVLAP
jgi:hypothetical protein